MTDRRPYPALNLAQGGSLMSAIGNDYGYDEVFARQVAGLGQKGDVLVAITTSGLSPNVVDGLEAAKKRGLRTIGITGRDGGHVGRMVDIHVNVPSDSTPRVQEVQRTLLHAICDLVERAFVDAESALNDK